MKTLFFIFRRILGICYIVIASMIHFTYLLITIPFLLIELIFEWVLTSDCEYWIKCNTFNTNTLSHIIIIIFLKIIGEV